MYVKTFFQVLILIMILSSCSKYEETKNCKYNGLILHYDNRECICCTGWYIKVANDTFKAYSLPKEQLIIEKMTKNPNPIAVKLSFKDTTDICHEDFKTITCLTIK